MKHTNMDVWGQLRMCREDPLPGQPYITAHNNYYKLSIKMIYETQTKHVNSSVHFNHSLLSRYPSQVFSFTSEGNPTWAESGGGGGEVHGVQRAGTAVGALYLLNVSVCRKISS